MVFRQTLPLLVVLLWMQTIAAQDESPWYAGLGASMSTLKPGTSDTIYEVTGDGGAGLTLLFGRRMTGQFSVEGVMVDLGVADIGVAQTGAVAGGIDYDFLGLNLKYDVLLRPSLRGYVKAGMGSLNLDTQLPLKQDGSMSGFFGLGAEWMLPNNFSLRGGYNYFSEDAQSFDVVVTKYFGGASGGFSLPRLKMPKLPKLSKPETGKTGKPSARPAQAPSANVEIINTAAIPGAATRMARKLKPNSLMVFLRFAPGSASLTDASRRLLDRTIERMNSSPAVRVLVMGGSSSAYNRDLAQSRGKAAGAYLARHGFPKEFLRYVRYSELRSKPIK